MITFTEAWGGGDGCVGRLTPATRLICGALVLASCATASLKGFYGIVLLILVLAGWIAGCGLPLRRLGYLLGFAACLFLPLLLLVPVASLQGGTASASTTLHAALGVGVRGTLCLLVCGATFAALQPAELRQGLAALPLPGAMAALILQVVHQSTLLAEDSRCMVMALRVRGVTSASLIARLRCLFALPVLWLLHLVLRAERVSAAMEVRGFDGVLRGEPLTAASAWDRCAVTLALLVFGVTFALRLGAA
ncbi:MAG: energy-coupling factor transporter transmembrane component T [Kiritimatiellia bacterium]